MKSTSDHKTASAHPGSAARARRTRPNKRILLVDDDPIVRDSLNNLLTGEGYAVISAGNGEQALDLATRSRIDLVLLDLNMPVKNGWDTFQQLTFEHPLIPVIIVTARPNQLFTALGAGAGALLEKPMDIPVLLRTIERLLAESAGQNLARLAGREIEFHYQAATANGEDYRAGR
jgi:DNA-binding response OmpR family regulator